MTRRRVFRIVSKLGIDFEAAQAVWRDNRAVEFSASFPVEQRFAIIGVIEEKLLDDHFYPARTACPDYFSKEIEA
jgi:uncharacterized DUF497 family protein